MKIVTQTSFLISLFFIAFTSTRVFGVPLNWILSIIAAVVLITELLLVRGNFSFISLFNHSWTLAAVLIFIGGCLSLLRSIDYANNLRETSQAVWTLLIMPPVLMLAMSRWPKKSLWILILGISINSVIAVWDNFTQMGIGALLATISITTKGISIPLGLYAVPTLFSTTSRYAGVLSHPNALGQITIVGFSITLAATALVLEKRRSILKLVLLILLLVIVYFSNVISGSVSGFIGINLAGGVVVMGLFFRRPTYAKLLIICFLLLLGISLIFIFQDSRSWTEIFTAWTSRNLDRAFRTTGPMRIQQIQHALYLVAKDPIIGYGMDLESGQFYFGRDMPTNTYYSYYGTGNVVIHNALLWSWLGGGIFAFLGTLIAYFVALKYSLKHILLFFRERSSYIMLGLSAATLGWIFVTMVQPTLFAPYIWISAFLLGREIDVDL